MIKKMFASIIFFACAAGAFAANWPPSIVGTWEGVANQSNFIQLIFTRSAIRWAFALLRGAALIAVSFTVGSTAALAQELTLINGWTNAPFSTSNAAVQNINGVVYFKGAIATSGSNVEPFVLPAGLRPATDVYVPVDLCGAHKGRLHIMPSGTVNVGGAFSSAKCFTSLDGATFALTDTGFTPLTLINGWTNAPFSTSNAAVQNINGVVHFKGAIATSGNNAEPFVLPAASAPATDVYVPVDLCNAANGRLHITPSGIVDIQAEGTFSNAKCFTSLDGATFALTDAGFTPLTLISFWTNAPFSTSNAAVQNIDGIVQFKGAIATSGNNAEPFVLPAALAPATDVYVPVDLCNAANGRLHITPSGTVDIQAEGAFSNAKCFTSLDGAWFFLPSPVEVDFQEMADFQVYCLPFDCADTFGANGLFFMYRITKIKNTGSQAVTFVFDVNKVSTVTPDQVSNDTVTDAGQLLLNLNLTQVTVQPGQTKTLNLCFIKDAASANPKGLVGTEVGLIYQRGSFSPVSMTNVGPNSILATVFGTATGADLRTLCSGGL